MNPTVRKLPLCQVALSSADLARSHAWYRDALGLVEVGEPRHAEGAVFAEVPGLPEAEFDVGWLVDQQPWFQFEIFEFQRPTMKPLRADWTPADIGYAMVGLHVTRFDTMLDRLASHEVSLLSQPIGPPGRRRVCVRDPDGVLLELMEDDPMNGRGPHPVRPALLVAGRSVTLSVPSLERALKFWSETIGFDETDLQLHGAEHESLWGLPGAKRRARVLSAGDAFIELVQYESPVGRPRPNGYMLSDQGILNVAIGSTDQASFYAVYERMCGAGYRPNRDPWVVPGLATVVYMNDDQGFSVELLCVDPDGVNMMGFIPE